MHMADALLSPAVGLTMCAISVAAVGVSVARVKKDELGENKIPVIGVSGAMVFAAQMINFSIPGTGSSGHIGGGILLAGLLGGIPAFLSITVVLIIQCLLFADGGLLALGCNIFNLGVIPCLLVYPILFRPIVKSGASYRRLSAASITSTIIALLLGAFCVVLQTQISGISMLPFGAFATLMLPIHFVIGIVEGVVTAAALCFVYKMRPEIINTAHSGEKMGGAGVKNVVIALAALAVIAGGALSLFSSKDPDGLEWAISKTAQQAGEEGEARASEDSITGAAASIQESTAILPDYTLKGDAENPAGTSIAGILGAAATFVLAVATGLIISFAKKRKRVVADG